MEVGRLTLDELVFEVAIRGKVLKGTKKKKPTVEDYRKCLRGLLADEARGAAFEDLLLPLNVEEEKMILESKFEQVKEGIEDLKAGTAEAPNAIRIRTLLSHCNRRLQRLFSNVKGNQREGVKPLFKDLKGFVAEFRGLNADEAVYQASSVPSVSDTKGDGSGSESENDTKKKNGPKCPKKSLDFHKWGISFSGSDDKSVLSFIMDLEEKAAWKGVALNYLVAGAAEFFTGRAKTWFRSVKSKVDSWEELKIALRSEFLPMDYYENLWEEIRLRKQGQAESIGAYVANMLALFERLEMIDEVSETLKLSIIRKNLNPLFTNGLALVEVLSINQLKVLGRQLEVSQARVESYAEAGKGKAKPMEPEFAYKTGTAKKAAVHALEADSSERKEGNRKPRPFSCFSCNKEGHKFSDCPTKSDRKFCYKCGRKDVIVRNCPKCSNHMGKGKGVPHPKKGEE